jgi:hypothetical protein
MKLEFKAGRFEIEAWTNGHPMWSKITYEGKEVLHGLHHNELRDLAYVIERMTAAIRRELPEPYKAEVD